MVIVLHQDFIEDYSAGDKEYVKENKISYLIDASGELVDKKIREKIALDERVNILNELKTDIVKNFEKEKSSFTFDKIHTDVCIDKEQPVKDCLMQYNKVESHKQFDHLTSCYHLLHAYEACLNRN